MPYHPRPEFISQVIKHLRQNHTRSITRAIEMADSDLSLQQDTPPDVQALQAHVQATLGTLSFPSAYAKLYGKKGADMQEKRVQWMAACLAAAHAELPRLPPIQE